MHALPRGDLHKPHLRRGEGGGGNSKLQDLLILDIGLCRSFQMCLCLCSGLWVVVGHRSKEEGICCLN